jgi:hypothetical protein
MNPVASQGEPARIIEWHDSRFSDQRSGFGIFRALFLAGIVEVFVAHGRLPLETT